MKNIGIYVHHHPKGDVQDYVKYAISKIIQIVPNLIVVVNGTIKPQEKNNLETLGATVLERENKGFDWSAWKYGLEYIGYEKLKEYDNVLITNNTYYGPIFPLENMWDEMSQRDCDFWGINKHPESKTKKFHNKNSIWYEHIQSYWIVFKKKIIASEDFKNYWKSVKTHKSYAEMIIKGELLLTHYFKNKGYKPDTYMDFNKYSALINSNPTFLTEKQIIEDKCPILKRKFLYDFYQNIYYYKTNNGPKLLLKYLEDNNLYNTDLILKDLISNAQISDINRGLENNFILPTENEILLEYKTNSKVVAIFYIYPKDMVEYCYNYIKKLPNYIDIIIVNTSKEVQDFCKEKFSNVANKIEYRMQINRGRDNSALLITCKDIFEKYDYFCFVHSKKSRYHKEDIHGINFCEHCFNNLLFDKTYINYIIKTFDVNKFLGILIPPFNINSSSEYVTYNTWTRNYKLSKKILKDYFNICGTELDPKIMAPIGGMFWGRTSAFKTLLSRKWSFEDFPEEPLKQTDGLLTHVIERIHPILAQNDGYYTSWCCPIFNAEIYLNDLYLIRRNKKPKIKYKNLEKVFSIKNEYQKGIAKKIITVMGIRIKF